MSKTLIVPEKPSVAADIAKALGGFQLQRDGEKQWYERGDALIASAVGHLVELVCPDGQDVGYDLNRLPVIPEPFGLKPVDKTKSKLLLIKSLAERSDVTSLVNACDAGREGELIFRYIVAAIRCKKPFTRMWLQSMTPESIRAAYKKQRSSQEMQGLYDAARCRSESDFLIGINGTRALTIVAQMLSGQRDTHTTGRVQGPTLAITVDLEEKIRTFVPKDYWEVRAKFGAQAGTYDGKWFDPNFKKPEAGEEEKQADRIWNEDDAKAIAQRCHGQQATEVKEESKPDSKAPPHLFDLTSLQREANKKFGFSAAQTLKLAQALYETHKVLTYPRTDAKVLPDDYVDTAKGTLLNLTGLTVGKYAQEAVEKGYVKPNPRIFDSSKVSDHFAIIPTGTVVQGLSADESKIYDLVTRRFIAVFFPAAVFLKTVRITSIGSDHFRSTGSVLQEAGWMAVYGREVADNDVAMCQVAAGELPNATEVKAVGLKTKPPERFTEATLLGAMEHAGRLVTDDDLRDAMSERGLGTPATRAATIEKLLYSGAGCSPYLVRSGKELVPQQKAMSTVALLRRVGAASLTSPEMTGEWEYQLKQMESGKVSRADFMKEIQEQTRTIVDCLRSEAKEAPAAQPLGAPCPKCGGAVASAGLHYSCSGCGLRVPRRLLDRNLEVSEVEALLRERQTPVLDGFVSGKTGKSFSASLKFAEDFSKMDFVFPPREAASEPAGETLGNCPKCGGAVHQRGDHYYCEKNGAAAESRTCDFRIYGERSGKTIGASVVKQLLSGGRSNLIDGFKGKSSGKKFSAYLVLLPDHQVGFEFES
ncbi:DNA topoisomerase [Ralstonia sp. ASV6]|uniref:DNA topoisomerase n=1 Tax=Ralstonia sp. ASV6 TaxID=2795124 RepID=UPI0018EC1845|nr:DNA topoisomerase [Ralstonia sp. ASV6]